MLALKRVIEPVFLPRLWSPGGGLLFQTNEVDMPSKAKTFQDRMTHKRTGKAVGETQRGGSVGHSVGEKIMGVAKMRKSMVAMKSAYSQSRDGNGG